MLPRNIQSVFRFHLHRFGLDALLAPQRPRHRWLKVVCGIFGIALMAVLLVIGVFTGIAILLFGLLRRILGGSGTSPQRRQGQVMDAEYRVVDSTSHTNNDSLR